jgi:hypothetical protein
MADADFGEMFHYFPMPDRIRKFSGLEVGPWVPFMAGCNTGGGKTERPVLGFLLVKAFHGSASQPLQRHPFCYWGEEFIRGNPRAQG